jgi:hypothetical protein
MAIEKEYTLKLTTKQAQENIDELNKSLKLQEDLIEDIEKEIRDYEKQINKTSARDLAQRKSLNDKIQKTKERLKDEKVALKSVNKDRKEANVTMKDSTANAKDYSGVLGIIDQKTGGAISGFTNLTSSVGGATKGFNLLKIAIIGTGIGALLIAITAVTAAFTSSEEGQNKFAKILAVVGSAVDNLVTLLSDLGEKIISVFENPKQAIKDFSNLIKENIVNRFEGLMELIPALGKAVSLLFKGEFSEAGKVAANAVGKVALGVEDVVGKTEAAISATKDFIDEIVKEGKIAGQIADQRAKADKLDRDLIIERANANRDRADLLEKAVNKEKFSTQERIEFLQEAGALEDEITNKEIAAANLRLQAKIAENKQANSTKDDLLEEANLKAKLIDLETAKLRKAKLVTTQIAALNAETRATEAAADAAQDLKDKEKDAAKILKAKELKTLKQQIATALALSEDEKRALEITKIQAHYTKLIELARAQGILTAELEAELNAAKVEATAAIAVTTEETETQTQADWMSRYQERLGKISAWVDLVGQTLGVIAQMQKANHDQENRDGDQSEDAKEKRAKRQFKAQKKLNLAMAVVNASQGILSSLAQAPVAIGPVPSPVGIASLAVATAAGIANIATIAKTKFSGGGGTPPAPPEVGQVTSAPPAFNVVGQSDTNQLADAIGGQEQQPVQAYVVANEITNAQELERNIIDGASIG